MFLIYSMHVDGEQVCGTQALLFFRVTLTIIYRKRQNREWVSLSSLDSRYLQLLRDTNRYGNPDGDRVRANSLARHGTQFAEPIRTTRAPGTAITTLFFDFESIAYSQTNLHCLVELSSSSSSNRQPIPFRTFRDIRQN